MEINMKTRNNPSLDNTSLLVAGVALLAISQVLEGTSNTLMEFVRGVLIGLSIVSSFIGLYLYGRAKNR
jgi:uncharacterized membrane protein SirB2